MGRAAVISYRAQRGVTLIELLIGLAIGVLVVLATMSLLLNMTHASARVAQTQDVSDAVRTSVGIVERTIAEAGFGLQDGAAFLSVSTSPGPAGHSNSVNVRSRGVPEPLSPVLASEIANCEFRIDAPTNQSPVLMRRCLVGAGPALDVPIVAGAVAFEVHSGCAVGALTRVARYRRGDCVGAEVRRSVRIAILVRATTPDPIPDRLVAENSYLLPSTVDVPGGAMYTVPTGASGVANGCGTDGECRAYKHRLVVSEVLPRNELFRAKVSF